jgi:hypothetical protein
MELGKLEKGDLKAEVKFVKGEIVAIAAIESSGIQSEVKITIPTDYFLDKLAEAIPGQIDDSLISVLKIALKAV